MSLREILPLTLMLSGIAVAMAMGLGLLNNSSSETISEDVKILMMPLCIFLVGAIFWMQAIITPESKVTQKEVDNINKIESKKILQKYEEMNDL